MRKYFLLLTLLFNSAFLVAQPEADRNERYLLDQKNPAQPDPEFKGYTGTYSDYHINSSALTNTFFKRVFFGGYIGEEIKDQVLRKAGNNNRAGMDLNGGAYFKYPMRNGSIIGAAGYREHLDMNFHRDVFELVFRGNAAFEGQSANLAPLRIRYFNAYHLFGGYEKTLNEKLILGGGISLIRGGGFQNLHIKRGTFYTETLGTHIETDLDFNMAFSDRDKRIFPKSNGLGASVTVYSTLLLNNGRLNFEIRDLGVINWKNLNHYGKDSVYRFEGAVADDILTVDDDYFSKANADSLSSLLNLQRTQKNISYLIPATFHLNYLHHFSEKLSISTGIKYLMNAGYIPRLYLKTIYYLRYDLILVPVLAYGGYGKANIETGISKSFKDSFIISLNAFYLEYLMVPDRSSGHGFNFALTKLL